VLLSRANFVKNLRPRITRSSVQFGARLRWAGCFVTRTWKLFASRHEVPWERQLTITRQRPAIATASQQADARIIKAQPRPARIDALTGIRFLAAISVVFYHYWEEFLPGTATPRPFDSGFMGVSFFFVLSGYILGYVYLQGSTPMIDTKRFMVARFARVYPSYALSFLLQFPLVGWLILRSPSPAKKTLIALGTLLAHLALLHAWWPRLDWRWNPPSWSLCAEAVFYLLFPAVAIWSARYTGSRRLVTLMCGSYIMMLAAPVILLTFGIGFNSEPRPELALFVLFAPLFRVPEFMIGILLSLLHKELETKYSAGMLTRPGTAATYSGLSLITAILLLDGRIPFILRYNGIADLAFAAIIFGLAASRGLLHKLLSLPILVLLGEASYSVYIFQTPLFDYLRPLLQRLAISNRAERILVFTAYVLVLVGLSVACFKYVETPIRRQITRWYASRGGTDPRQIA
jgi:peptidoglycan/LPS O-acetylase OafA/YrhL